MYTYNRLNPELEPRNNFRLARQSFHYSCFIRNCDWEWLSFQTLCLIFSLTYLLRAGISASRRVECGGGERKGDHWQLV